MRRLTWWEAFGVTVVGLVIGLASWKVVEWPRTDPDSGAELAPPDFSRFEKREPRLTPEQCDALVAQLVNPNKPPFIPKRPFDLPEGYDFRSQDKIEAAYNELSANVEDALPTLMKSRGDKRFSYIYEHPLSGVFQTQSVGGACSEILQAHIEVYHQHTRRWVGETGKAPSLYHDRGETSWWDNWQEKTLAQLQYEGIAWAMRQKQPHHFKSEADWAEVVAALRKMAITIRDSRKPIPVDHKIDLHYPR